MQGSDRASQERMVYMAIGLVFALLLAGYLAYKLAVVVLVLLLTILFSIIMSAPVDYLSRPRLRDRRGGAGPDHRGPG